VRVVELRPPSDISFWDFSQAERLVEFGRQAAKNSLEDQPVENKAGWWERLISLWSG
jgi:hypothetical protein